MKVFSLQQAVAATGGEFFGDPALLSQNVQGVVIDNREVQDGFLFIPIIGEQFDGHTFIPSAYDAGALCCLSEKKLDSQKPYILVKSTLDAFQALAAWYRTLFDIRLIAITGSAGKTTTKEMIAAVLAQKYQTLKTEGNLNNQTGVPKMLFRLEPFHQVAVIEMGTNHFGEIEQLSKIAQPNDCVITNIGEAHIEHFGSKEGTLRAKCEITSHQKPGGTLFICGDDNLLFPLQSQQKSVVSYGFMDRNTLRVARHHERGLSGTDFTVSTSKGECAFHLPYPGKHMVLAALAAIAVGFAYGMTTEEIQSGLACYAPVGGRMNIQKGATVTILDDSYNANPSSMKAALDILNTAAGRKVCILGDMFELGEQSGKYHYEVGKYAADKGIDHILLVGTGAKMMYDGAASSGGNAVHFATVEALCSGILSHIQSGDTVLVKASRGMKLEHILPFLLDI
ncbi:MAG: UDP-N-acetylmuramoyl-tripeptide--D-alanyl-D-alanine ligase [Christensenellaceae bacterium]|jgi:UDP-N-acetylmuramoyl-tripeptide--D-alanyl-D-alanine ligase